mgnify:CR=1 FL=1
MNFQGCYTAIVTPMKGKDAGAADFRALEKLVEFQIASGVSGILAVGTTGESPTLDWDEHSQIITKVKEFSNDRCAVIGGTGSNSTREALHSTRRVAKSRIDAVLLVDPYYNGPSSVEIRKEYVAPVAEAFSDLEVIPYVIPGRTGAQLLPEDLAILHEQYDNVNAVKEATGDLENMKRTRELCGKSMNILSGDDDKTYSMMADDAIGAGGVVSVISNVAPAAVQQMTREILDGNIDEGKRLYDALKPLFGIVTVKTQEESPFGSRLCKARNPLPIKTLMRVLGMPVGGVRRPLGKMTRKGLNTVLKAARKVWKNNPEVLEPVGKAFDVDVEERLFDPKFSKDLAYEEA